MTSGATPAIPPPPPARAGRLYISAPANSSAYFLQMMSAVVSDAMPHASRSKSPASSLSAIATEVLEMMRKKSESIYISFSPRAAGDAADILPRAFRNYLMIAMGDTYSLMRAERHFKKPCRWACDAFSSVINIICCRAHSQRHADIGAASPPTISAPPAIYNTQPTRQGAATRRRRRYGDE